MAVHVSNAIGVALKNVAPWISFEERAASIVVTCRMCRQSDTFSSSWIDNSGPKAAVNSLLEMAAVKKHLGCPDLQRRYMVEEAQAHRSGYKMPSYLDWVETNRPGALVPFEPTPPPSSSVPLDAKRQISLEDE